MLLIISSGHFPVGCVDLINVWFSTVTSQQGLLGQETLQRNCLYKSQC